MRDDGITIPQALPSITADEIPWSLAPVARIEDEDVLKFNGFLELLEYVAHLQDESRSLRRMVHESIALVARQRDQCTRATQTIERQRREFATYRQNHQAAA